MILGLDVSTTRIGWAIINQKQELIDSGVFKTKKDQSLEERAENLSKNVLEPLSVIHRISEVRVEEPFSMFSGGKTTAKTMSSLQRFNGMVSLLAHQIWDNPPTMVNSRTARARCGIKVTSIEDLSHVSSKSSGRFAILIFRKEHATDSATVVLQFRENSYRCTKLIASWEWLRTW